MKALIIREPYIGLILSGQKTWELRARACSHRGLTGLIRAGSKKIYGVGYLTDCLPPLTDAEIRKTSAFHAISETALEDVLRSGWRVPWVLSDVRILPLPVSYEHSSQVTWVNLTGEETALVLAQLSGTKSERSTIKPYNKTFPMVTPAAGSLKNEKVPDVINRLPHLSGVSRRSITEPVAAVAPTPPVVTAKQLADLPLGHSISERLSMLLRRIRGSKHG